jgi:large subunit ribosomal protein L21
MNQPVFNRYAIFQTGGKQYQAIEGKTLAIEKLDATVGETVMFTDVLLRKTAEDEIVLGKPFVKSAIKAIVLKHDKDKKLIIFKFKRRKMSRVKRGHRQPFTVIRIESI